MRASTCWGVAKSRSRTPRRGQCAQGPLARCTTQSRSAGEVTAGGHIKYCPSTAAPPKDPGGASKCWPDRKCSSIRSFASSGWVNVHVFKNAADPNRAPRSSAPGIPRRFVATTNFPATCRTGTARDWGWASSWWLASSRCRACRSSCMDEVDVSRRKSINTTSEGYCRKNSSTSRNACSNMQDVSKKWEHTSLQALEEETRRSSRRTPIRS
mmetsp:Transcript_71369/g.190234  ORF Transcript_71369/g.190234 Transcript_71369/m.190234 type:complete len:212 (-) Transcript_71369:181-816(-)